MEKGEGDGGLVEVPLMANEVEVETETIPLKEEEVEVMDSSPRREDGSGMGQRRRAFYRLRPPFPVVTRAPFKNAQGFGNWLFENLDDASFFKIHMTLLQYCRNFYIKKVVRIGKQMFRDTARIHFLTGLHMVVISDNQKTYISSKIEQERRKILRRKLVLKVKNKVNGSLRALRGGIAED